VSFYQITEFLKNDELIRLMETLKNWPNKMSSCFIQFALYTGLKRGEMFKLTWEDVDLVRKTVKLKSPKDKNCSCL